MHLKQDHNLNDSLYKLKDQYKLNNLKNKLDYKYYYLNYNR